MVIYIVAIIVSVLLMVILFFSLRSTAKRIDHNTKKYFVDKLQDYDYLIEEKQKIIDELDNKIKNKKNDLEELSNEKNTIKNKENYKYYNNDKIPLYNDKNIFKKYKTIKEKFPIDYEYVIRNFIKNNLTDDNKDYYIAFKIKEIFTNDVVYKILNLKKFEQKQKILSLLTIEQKEFLSKTFDDEFDIKKLLMKLNNFIEKNDPKIYVYVGSKNIDLNFISDKIETIVDNSVNEGMKISYKGNLYDYSL